MEYIGDVSTIMVFFLALKMGYGAYFIGIQDGYNHDVNMAIAIKWM